MMTSTLKKTISLVLAVLLVIGMMPAIPGAVNVAHANTTITEVSVTGITLPKVGKTPAYTASVAADAAYYIGAEIDGLNYDVNGISWAKRIGSASSEIASSTIFEEGVSYDVRMELYAKDGYTFDVRDNLNITINGEKGRVISRYDNKIYIGYVFPALEAPKTIESIKFSHDTEIKDRQTVGKVKVSEINGSAYEGPEVVATVNWYRSTANFTNINESGVEPWNGTAFDGGYAYGLRIEMPDLDGYVYPPSFVVSLETPGTVYHSEQMDANGVCYFFWNKLAHIPQLEYVNITMDGFYVGENITKLTFTSNEEVRLDGGYGSTKRYTIKQLNANQDYEVLSNTTFQANKNYYLCYYLESALDLDGLNLANVKLNGKAAIEKGVENGRTYYLFSLGSLSEGDIVKTPVTSIVVSLPKAQPAAGDDLYYPTVVSVNGDTKLSNVVSTDNVVWYQNDFHVPEEVDYAPADSKFVQGKSYILWMSLNLVEGYELADTYNVTVQSPSGNLEGILDSKGESYVTYEYYFNLGAPTELPMLSSYTVELSGYQAGAKIEDTALTMIMNGLSLPKEMLAYGMIYTIANENQEPILKGPFDYDTQYYLGTIVAPYNCKIDGLDEAQIKSMATLHGMHPESVTAIKPGEQILGWEAYFKLPILKQDSSCNGLNHEFIENMVPATFDTDGKFYQNCKGCGTEGETTVIPKISTVQLSKTEYTYNGMIQCPDIIVKDSTGKVLTEGQDYSLMKPENSNAVGSYTIKVILQGNYSGTKSLSYEIKDAIAHICSPTKVPEKAATCAETGKQAYYACSCGKSYEDKDGTKLISDINSWGTIEKDAGKHVGGTEIVNVKSADHKTQTAGYTGDTKCLGCGTILSSGTAVSPTAHKAGESWLTDGTHHWKVCTVDGCGIVVDKAAHGYGNGYICDTCKYENETLKPDPEAHKCAPVLVKGKTATYTEDGQKDYYKCSCGKYYEDAGGTKVITNISGWGKIAKASTVKLSYTKKVYTGSTLKAPALTVKDSNDKDLVKGTDYNVTGLTGKKSVGRYAVKITFTGNYSGSKTLYFNIVPKKTTSAKAVLYGYDDIKFSWSKVTGASGYLVSYKKGSGSWSKAVATTGTSYKKANLSDGVKYTFKVVPYYRTKTSTVKYYDANQYKTAYTYTLKKVTGVKVAKSGTKVKVSWTNISGESGYQISKMTKKSATQKKPLTYKTTSGKYKKLSATKGKTYYYKVRAYKTVNGKNIYGPWSTVKAYKRK